MEILTRRAIQALVDGRLALGDLDPEVRDFIGRIGVETIEILERIASEKLEVPDEEDDSYYCYVAADIVCAVVAAVMRQTPKRVNYEKPGERPN